MNASETRKPDRPGDASSVLSSQKPLRSHRIRMSVPQKEPVENNGASGRVGGILSDVTAVRTCRCPRMAHKRRRGRRWASSKQPLGSGGPQPHGCGRSENDQNKYLAASPSHSSAVACAQGRLDGPVPYRHIGSIALNLPRLRAVRHLYGKVQPMATVSDNRGVSAVIQILIVEDFNPFRQFICSKLREKPELQVVGEVSDGMEGVRKAEELQPDLILLMSVCQR
jgi:hypothetical protein